MTKSEITQALNSGVKFLASQQRPDGGFDGFVSPVIAIAHPSEPRPTIFFTSLISQCCAVIPIAKGIMDMAIPYLLRHRSNAWSWNYWQRDVAGAKMRQYPDDLDDTACTLAAIIVYDSSLVDGSVLGYLGQQLVAAETQSGGPYGTWLVPRVHLEKWKEVDLAVNANIACMLSLLNAMPPGLEYYICQSLKTNQLRSSYYPGRIHLLYLITRSNLPAARNLLRRHLNTELAQIPADCPDLLLALLLSTACRLGYSKKALQGLASKLLASRHHGHWLASAFYIESCFGGIPSYAGSDALTTALACEALSLYLELVIVPKVSLVRRLRPAPSSVKAFRVAEVFSNTIPGNELRVDYKRALRMIRRQDKDGQISGLASRLNKDIGAVLPEAQLRHLQISSINGWVAYTLYDNILDAQDPVARLCTANLALRVCVEELRQALPDSLAFQQFSQQTLTMVDSANAWESGQARAVLTGSHLVINKLPEYADLSQLAERSWGHVLATCAVLIAHGFQLDGLEIRLWLRFFHHFLIARQLNDDAHDWQQDIACGQFSAVVCMLLRTSSFPLRLDLALAMPELRQRFWQETVILVSGIITEHLKLAEDALARCDSIQNKQYYQGLLDNLHGAVAATKTNRTQALAFMQSFTGKVSV